ncbi:hypothetical protein CPB83DRAFT_400765 [Crepidotus variabilis]|uniref:CUE domain-containing protein n=1 Tax=Crepidotus variabilis TaxID=179855 RepID=A0A9P6JP70_9AGAR|nr:hypothetical protein CPB83DRAFT_400765 [Crepidotus variabilis]
MSQSPPAAPAEIKPVIDAELPDIMTPPPPLTNHGRPPTDISAQRPNSTSPPPRTLPQAQQRESPIDPRVVALRAMFPDYEDVILQSVLESVNWNQDRAVDALLTMSDPEYKPEPAAQRQSEPIPVLEDLDEQFARQLAMQEQQEHSQWAASGQNYGPQGSPAPYNGPRSNQTQGWTSPPQQGGAQQGQGIAEFQDQFNKFAETGKKTLGSIFNKVRTKIQEFEQGKPSNAGGSTSPPLASQYSATQWAPGPASYYGPPQAGPPQAQASYYNPNQSPVNTPSPPQPPAPVISNLSGLRSTSPPSTSPHPSTNLQSRPRSVSPPATNTAMTAQPIDGGKLRLPPKQQPISLMALQDSHSIDSASSADSPTIPSAQPQVTGAAGKTPGTSAGATSTHASNKGYSIDDDDDGLEYTENPFDEGRK